MSPRVRVSLEAVGRVLATLLAGWVLALGATSPAAQGDLEERARKVEGKLMAPCCMANTVAEHESGAAHRMRREIRAMLGEGRTEQEILDHYVAQYGDQILAAPVARGFGLTAYVFPFLFLFVGLGLVAVLMRRWYGARAVETNASEAPLVDPEYARRLQRELRELE